MTILDPYTPYASTDLTTDTHGFDFPVSSPDAVEVYEIVRLTDNTLYQYLVPPGDYTLTFSSPQRTPSLSGGKVEFLRDYYTQTEEIRIKRNTLIDQTVDFPSFTAFNGRMVEYALDKATMICQEIADRKCNVVVATPMTQEIIFDGYRTFDAEALNFATDKLYQILLEIDQSADDCTDTPENA
jgi:hypothetical protein